MAAITTCSSYGSLWMDHGSWNYVTLLLWWLSLLLSSAAVADDLPMSIVECFGGYLSIKCIGTFIITDVVGM